MKAEAKAKEIVAAMFECADTYGEAKQCAMVAVDFMIEAQQSCFSKEYKDLYKQSDEYIYLQKVKTKIELL